MAKNNQPQDEEQVEFSLQDLLNHARLVDANVRADQLNLERESVKEQFGLVEPDAAQTPVAKPPTQTAAQKKAAEAAAKKEAERQAAEKKAADEELAKQQAQAEADRKAAEDDAVARQKASQQDAPQSGEAAPKPVPNPWADQ